MLSNLSFLFAGGFIMGWGPCLAYSAPLLLPYIGGTKTGWQEGLKIGLSLVGILPKKLFKSAKILRTFQVVCGVVLILFGLRLFHYVLNIL